MTLRPLFPALALAALLPGVARAEDLPPPRSRAVAVTLELLSPAGGAGCFYRRRPVLGALVTAVSLISGGTMIHGLVRHRGDEVSLNAVAYGVSRFIGLVAAARPEPAPLPAALPALPPPRTTLAAPHLGLSYGFAF